VVRKRHCQNALFRVQTGTQLRHSGLRGRFRHGVNSVQGSFAASALLVTSRLCSIAARSHGMPLGLIVIGAVLVAVVGIVMYFLMRRDEPPEPPHFGK
jgi:hypothetical protein